MVRRWRSFPATLLGLSNYQYTLRHLVPPCGHGSCFSSPSCFFLPRHRCTPSAPLLASEACRCSRTSLKRRTKIKFKKRKRKKTRRENSQGLHVAICSCLTLLMWPHTKATCVRWPWNSSRAASSYSFSHFLMKIKHFITAILFKLIQAVTFSDRSLSVLLGCFRKKPWTHKWQRWPKSLPFSPAWFQQVFANLHYEHDGKQS